jgi:BirA family biotin operon repressor/biotin-[acetyl-CoA-carboxylase] ligase
MNKRRETAITADEVRNLLKNEVIGKRIYAFTQLGSTNDHIRRLARNGEEEGAVVVADTQTRGRGRHHRPWFSPQGKGLWVSVLLRPTKHWDKVGLMSLLTGLTVAEAIAQQTKVFPMLKWPNDVMVDGKKISGILIESEIRQESIGGSFLALGIGINVSHRPNDFPDSLRDRATSLLIETGMEIDRVQLLATVLHKLEDHYRRFVNGDHDFIRDEWWKKCLHRQKLVRVVCGKTTFNGIFEKIGANGEMLLRTDDGELRRIQAGEVSNLGLEPSQKGEG